MSVVETDAHADLQRPSETSVALAEAPLRRFLSDYFASWIATIALATLLLIACVAVLAPVLAPQNPYNLAEVDILDSRLPPGSMGMAGYRYWLGTDGAGRDLV